MQDDWKVGFTFCSGTRKTINAKTERKNQLMTPWQMNSPMDVYLGEKMENLCGPLTFENCCLHLCVMWGECFYPWFCIIISSIGFVSSRICGKIKRLPKARSKLHQTRAMWLEGYSSIIDLQVMSWNLPCHWCVHSP